MDLELTNMGPVAEISLGQDTVVRLAQYDHSCAVALRDLVFDLGDDDQVKAIALTGREGEWSARGEAPRKASRTEAQSSLFSAYLGDAGIYQQICFSRKPVIAAVEGECDGPGSLIALYSTLAVAGNDVRFWSPFVDFPEANFAVAVFTMRLNRAKSWSLRNRPLEAERAQRFGLVNEVVRPGAARERALALAREIAKRPLDAITMSRTQVWGFMDSRGIDRDFGVGALYTIATGVPAEGAVPSDA